MEAEQDTPVTSTSTNARTPRLLVVDDEPSVAMTLSEVLRSHGWDVDAAHSGEEGLEFVRKNEYDVVLSDLRMDGVDGIAILNEVRRRSPTTATIVLTAFASLGSSVAALREGAYDYLTKPCSIDDLKSTVSRGIERRRLALEVRETRRRLEEVNADLERMVAQKTAELQAANEDLVRANKAKDIFLATTSHELRTPLTPIIGWIRVLRSDRATPDLLDQGLDVIDRNARLQMKLIDDLLDVSRIISGKLAWDPEPVDFAAVVRHAIDTVRERASEQGIEIVNEGGETRAMAQGSELRLLQIVANLLSNAVKFTGKGGTIRVRLTVAEDEFRLTVSDNGCGIHSDRIESIFDIFSQGPEGPRGAESGLGLGLAISRRLAEMHGGSLVAESDGAGRGSTFTFLLPKHGTGPVPE